MTEENSIAYWYPKIKDLVPTPRTEIFPIEAVWSEDGNSLTIDDDYFEPILKKAEEMGFPIFVRANDGSDKHEWRDTCYVEKKEDLRRHIGNLLIWSMDNFLPYNAIALREFIKMDTGFTAFYLGMPVNPERRYFVKDGKIVCHHPYWIEDAIHGSKEELPENWKEILKEMNMEEQGEIDLLTSYAEKIGKEMAGYWSIDFCRTKEGKWLMIDCARGQDSWHQEGCPNKISNLKQGA
jgi:hypothetical protein